jgi:hypothetical protein
MSRRLLGGLRRWFRAHVADQVPPTIEACEFDCRIVSCPPERLHDCPRRLEAAAAHACVCAAEAGRAEEAVRRA